ncbi:MAG: RsmD family RNA methyltransferase [Propionibacteriaceae bacterium]|jgi:16S rRNA (guanine966-N2)-methyltransferase|nr:RsmD family RNA methyltransferase [Propionibacteriaceae bacterium]
MSRIVAGRFASRRVATPPGAGTRPTSDRVREAVFSLLAAELGSPGPADQQLAGLAFLDLYAGSGAVGLEAASRGAAAVTWVERDKAACQVIERNQRELGAVGTVVRSDVGAWLAGRAARSAPERFDVAWLDPPYDVATEVVDDVAGRLAAGRLAPGALVLVERSARGAAPQFGGGFHSARTRDYGDTCVHVARWAPTESEQAEETEESEQVGRR